MLKANEKGSEQHMFYITFPNVKNRYKYAGYMVKSLPTYFVARKGDSVVIGVKPNMEHIYCYKDLEKFVRARLDEDIAIKHLNMEDVFIIMYANEEHSHHYLGHGNIALIYQFGNFVYSGNDPRFAKEKALASEAISQAYIHGMSQIYNSPYGRRYSSFVVYVIAAALAYIFTKNIDYTSYGLSLQNLKEGRIYCLLTYMFFHVDIRHLAGNLLALIIVGRQICQVEGGIRFVITYVGSGMLAAIFEVAYKIITGADSLSSTVGTSGAIMGLVAAMLVMAFYDYDMETEKSRYIVTSLMMAAANIFLVGPGTDVICHVTGFAAGFIISIVIGRQINDEKFRLKEKYNKMREIHMDPEKKRRFYTGPQNDFT